MSELEGRVALITGASRGVGAALAKALDARGVKLALGSRSGGDARDRGRARRRVRRPRSRRSSRPWLRPRSTVSAASTSSSPTPASAATATSSTATRSSRTRSSTSTSRASCIPSAPASRPCGAAIAPSSLAVASIAGQRAPEGEAVYAAAKHAQVGFMRSLDHELFKQGIRCSILCPGGIATEFAMGRGRTPDDPDLELFMSAEEVAEVAVYALERPRSAAGPGDHAGADGRGLDGLVRRRR